MVRAQVIRDYTDNELARVVVDRDGVRILDLPSDDSYAVSRDRGVDERVRAVLHQVNQGITER